MTRRAFIGRLLGLTALAVVAPTVDLLPRQPTKAEWTSFSEVLKAHYLDPGVIHDVSYQAGPLVQSLLASEWQHAG
jgi:hypothetical protein